MRQACGYETETVKPNLPVPKRNEIIRDENSPVKPLKAVKVNVFSFKRSLSKKGSVLKENIIITGMSATKLLLMHSGAMI